MFDGSSDMHLTPETARGVCLTGLDLLCWSWVQQKVTLPPRSAPCKVYCGYIVGFNQWNLRSTLKGCMSAAPKHHNRLNLYMRSIIFAEQSHIPWDVW